MKSTLAAFYRRVSTDDQDNSIDAQEAYTVEYARFKRAGLDPSSPSLLPPDVTPLIFSDPDTSGSIPLFERPGGRALLARLHRGDIGHLIVAKLDRLGRNCGDYLAVAKRLEEYGVVLHIVAAGGDSLSTAGYFGKLVLTILAAVAEAELEQIRDNTRKGLANKRRLGQLVGKIPYGWDCIYTFDDGYTIDRATVLQVGRARPRRADSGAAAIPTPPAAPRLAGTDSPYLAGTDSPYLAHDLSLDALEAIHGACLRKDMVENPVEQANILRMARLRWPSWPDKIRKGMSFVRIAKHLNALGIPPKTPAGSLLDLGHGRTAITDGTWSVGSVGGILSSEQVETLRLAAIKNLPNPHQEQQAA